MIYLIRHGQTEFNVEGRLQGQRDSPLTELGVEQARRMGRRLKAVIDDPGHWSVIASPLGRTRRTAEIVCETMGLDCEIQLDPRLAEVRVGEWEGLTRAEIAALRPGLLDQPEWIYTAPGGESRKDIEQRLSAWLASVDEGDGRKRLAVSHGAAGRILRDLYDRGAREVEWPAQDTVFRLFGGTVEKLDLPVDNEGEAGAGRG